MKTCRLCERALDDIHFDPDPSRRDGLLSRCRKCDSETKRARQQRDRKFALDRYGGRCACCSEARYEFLELDHPNGGGTRHRLEVGNGDAFYRWLKRSGYPDGLRVLCANCNSALGRYGYCPHTQVVVTSSEAAK